MVVDERIYSKVCNPNQIFYLEKEKEFIDDSIAYMSNNYYFIRNHPAGHLCYRQILA